MFAVSLRTGCLLLVLTAGGLPPAVQAQQKGDTMEVIERALGQPAVTLNRGGNVIWSYANGRKVTFRKGLALEVTAPVVETKKDADGEEEEYRAPVRPIATLPVTKRDDTAMLSRRAADLAPHHVGVIEWALRLAAIAVGVVAWTLRRPFSAGTV